MVVYGRELVNKQDFYTVPIASSNFDIYQADLIETPPKYWKLNLIEKKLFAMKDDDHMGFFPVIHSSKKSQI